ncbi:hypothetical protein Sbal625DRAFT_4406 [Shewanella baltica OS625]|nr:hypothetical protein Sbal625DRAFT_4406 [Shewanella baltica OS625]
MVDALIKIFNVAIRINLFRITVHVELFFIKHQQCMATLNLSIYD